MQQVIESFAIKLLLLLAVVNQVLTQPQETEKLQLKNILEQQLLLNSQSLQAPKLPAHRNKDNDNFDEDIADNDDNDDNDDTEDNEDSEEDEPSFYDHYGNGAYAYGYSLPGGVRRFERGYFADGQSTGNMIIEGFYTQLRVLGTRQLYELRCYNADNTGYHVRKVQYLDHPPVLRRYILPDVNCFNSNI